MLQYQNIKECLERFPKIVALIIGLFMKLCFCKGMTWPILLVPIFLILLLILRKSSKNQSFLIGYSFGIGYFLSSLYWVAESFKCVGYGNWGYLAVAALVLYLAIYSGLACYLTKRFATTRLNFILFFAVFWTITEYLRGIVFTGFPWNLIGYSAYDIPYFAQVADIFGVYGVSFILILTISLISFRKTLAYGAALGLVVMIYGYYKVNFSNYILPKNNVNITIVQPSITQEDKLDVSKFKPNLDQHIKLSHFQDSLYKGARLVIWPEAAVNIPLTSHQDIIKYIASSIKYGDTYLITGCDRFDEHKNLYNSLIVLSNDGKINQTYDKQHLLPFGEFIPKFLLNFGLKKLTKGLINFSRGKLSRTMKIGKFDPFDCVICYEIAFPGEIIENPKSTWILNITNDSWFKDSDGPTQHLKTACFRAIEEGRGIVRCANNGISAVINCNGELEKILTTDEVGNIESKFPARYHKTVFSTYKNKTILIVLTLSLLVLLFKRKRIKTRVL